MGGRAQPTVAKAQKFSATILKDGMNRYVSVPKETSLALGLRGNIPVEISLNGLPFRGTLVPAGRGRHVLYINGGMRRAAGVGPGDRISLSLKLDEKPRPIIVPAELIRALRAKGALAAFNSLVPSKRREMMAYLNYLKGKDARERTIKKIVEYSSRLHP